MGTRIIDLPDGRELCWTETGDRDGAAVLFMHGTSADRRQVATIQCAPAELGVRLIAPDRPGYGHSTLAPSRTLRDWADDVTVLVDHLGIDAFTIVAHSGGAPHALACARFMPERVRGVAVCGGAGPWGQPGSEAGMAPHLRFAVRLARSRPGLAWLPFAAMSWFGRRWPARAVAGMRAMAPRPDRAILGEELFGNAVRRAMATAACTHGRACGCDVALIAADWGFRLEEISVPVTVWHGDADTWIPRRQAEAVARSIPSATLRLLPGAGHFFYVEHMAQIIRSVTSEPV